MAQNIEKLVKNAHLAGVRLPTGIGSPRRRRKGPADSFAAPSLPSRQPPSRDYVLPTRPGDIPFHPDILSERAGNRPQYLQSMEHALDCLEHLKLDPGRLRAGHTYVMIYSEDHQLTSTVRDLLLLAEHKHVCSPAERVPTDPQIMECLAHMYLDRAVPQIIANRNSAALAARILLLPPADQAGKIDWLQGKLYFLGSYAPSSDGARETQLGYSHGINAISLVRGEKENWRTLEDKTGLFAPKGAGPNEIMRITRSFG